MHLYLVNLIISIATLGIAIPMELSAQEYTPPSKGHGLIDCECMPASSLCPFEVFKDNDVLAFTRDISFAGGSIDLAEACWREADRRTDIKCCLLPSGHDPSKFFRGKVSQFVAD